jgi:hypothetical protein
VEVRVQEHQVDRAHRIRRDDAGNGVARIASRRNTGSSPTSIRRSTIRGWSQKTERRIAGTASKLFADRIPTRPFNGYAAQVASMYAGMDLRKVVLKWVPIAKGVVHALALLPCRLIGLKIYEVARTGDGLGADPVAAIEHFLGLWALRFLMLALAITPLRQLDEPTGAVRFRRMLGLYAFSTRAALQRVPRARPARYWTTIFAEIAKRPYITVGFTAWLLLLPLAITSTKGLDQAPRPQLGAPAQAGLRDRRARGAALLVAGEIRYPRARRCTRASSRCCWAGVRGSAGDKRRMAAPSAQPGEPTAGSR